MSQLMCTWSAVGKALLFLGWTLFFAWAVLPGCRFRASPPPAPPALTTGKTPHDPSSSRPADSGERPGRPQEPARGAWRPSTTTPRAAEPAHRRDQEITARLEQANDLLRRQNIEGALRLVQRVARENGQDPYVLMRTSYLEAMIFHRMRDGARRKDAMDRLMKNMESLQRDPRFRQGFLDGMASQELIKMSIERGRKAYGP